MMTLPTPDTVQEITPQEREIEMREYLREQQSLAAIEQLRFFPLTVSGGRGATLTTASNRMVIDFSASWTASGVGHSHPAVVDAVERAIRNQGGTSCLSAATLWSTELTEQLCALIPVRGEARAYLGLSGSDANDVAIRAVQHHTGKSRVISFDGSYHGGLGVSQQASGMADPDATENAARLLLPYPETASQLDEVSEQLERALGTGEFAAVIVEPVQCDGGVRVPAEGFLTRLRAACDRHGALLIIDEVKVGLGRTGRLLAHQREDAVADIVTLGKSLGGGLPVSAVVGSRELLSAPVASALLTAAGSPVACAAASAALGVLAQAALFDEVNRLGAVFAEQLANYRQSDRPGAASISDVRGQGLLFGIELGSLGGIDGSTFAAMAAYRAWELGLVVYVVRDNVLECTPALTITEAELVAGIQRLLVAIDDVAQGCVDPEDVAQFEGW
ncbi:aminotransferase class III-fold pyridoxal phosphate-dependent enzyme [Gulosibacter sp. GYB002]|uniref:class-III pyridoxal-phosphate-dependent aminotransferase n=1 Tax=Gulosibacter sp. GYB002 TaxID=2994391 RepID=UPI002F964B0D